MSSTLKTGADWRPTLPARSVVAAGAKAKKDSSPFVVLDDPMHVVPDSPSSYSDASVMSIVAAPKGAKPESQPAASTMGWAERVPASQCPGQPRCSQWVA